MFFETDIDMLQKQELALPASLFKRKTVKWTTAHLRLWISIGNNMKRRREIPYLRAVVIPPLYVPPEISVIFFILVVYPWEEYFLQK